MLLKRIHERARQVTPTGEVCRFATLATRSMQGMFGASVSDMALG